jgi:hypothetical protein
VVGAQAAAAQPAGRSQAVRTLRDIALSRPDGGRKEGHLSWEVWDYDGPCGCLGGHCAVQKSIIYIYSIFIYSSFHCQCQNPAPNGTYCFVVVRATSGLLFGLIDTMGSVDSGAITPLLRTSDAPLGRPAALGLR